ncbi:hypothetical protein JCM3775_005942 [Rhodotorula graminis]
MVVQDRRLLLGGGKGRQGQLVRRTTVIADGTSLQSGTLFDSVDWQASGVLLEGCDIFTAISDCHTLALAPSGQLARRSDPGFDERNRSLVARAAPRQRIEFLSRPNSRAGETWTYSWSFPSRSRYQYFYSIRDLRSNARLLTYSRSSTNLPDNGYLKTGLYRAIIEGATSATAYVGDSAFARE